MGLVTCSWGATSKKKHKRGRGPDTWGEAQCAPKPFGHKQRGVGPIGYGPRGGPELSAQPVQASE